MNRLRKFREEIGKNACLGFGAGVESCPSIFRISDIDKKNSFSIEQAGEIVKENRIVARTLELDELECVRKAAETCPFSTIHITRLETNEKFV